MEKFDYTNGITLLDNSDVPLVQPTHPKMTNAMQMVKKLLLFAFLRFSN